MVIQGSVDDFEIDDDVVKLGAASLVAGRIVERRSHGVLVRLDDSGRIDLFSPRELSLRVFAWPGMPALEPGAQVRRGSHVGIVVRVGRKSLHINFGDGAVPVDVPTSSVHLLERPTTSSIHPCAPRRAPDFPAQPIGVSLGITTPRGGDAEPPLGVGETVEVIEGRRAGTFVRIAAISHAGSRVEYVAEDGTQGAFPTSFARRIPVLDSRPIPSAEELADALDLIESQAPTRAVRDASPLEPAEPPELAAADEVVDRDGFVLCVGDPVWLNGDSTRPSGVVEHVYVDDAEDVLVRLPDRRCISVDPKSLVRCVGTNHSSSPVFDRNRAPLAAGDRVRYEGEEIRDIFAGTEGTVEWLSVEAQAICVAFDDGGSHFLPADDFIRIVGRDDGPNTTTVRARRSVWKAVSAGVVGRIADAMQWALERRLPADRRESWRTAENWRERYAGRAIHHLAAFQSGQSIEPESKLPQLVHLSACAAILLARELEDAGVDGVAQP